MTAVWHPAWARRLPRSALKAAEKAAEAPPQPKRVIRIEAMMPPVPVDLIAEQMRAAHRLLGGVPECVKSRTILKIASYFTGYTIDDLRSNTRKRPIVRVRQAVCWLMSKYGTPKPSTVYMGHLLHKDHSTVVHALQRVESNPERYADVIEPVMDALKFRGLI